MNAREGRDQSADQSEMSSLPIGAMYYSPNLPRDGDNRDKSGGEQLATMHSNIGDNSLI